MYGSAEKTKERVFEPIVAHLPYATQFHSENDDLFNRPEPKWTIPIRNKPYKSLIKTTSRVNQADDFIEGVDAVIQKDLTNSNDSESQELILRIKTTPGIPERDNIGKRLLDLFQFSKEDQPDFIGIREESLKSFYNFLRNYTTLKRPAITLTPDNNIYASWRGDGGRVFSIHFLADNDVRFVIFSPNKRRPNRKTRTSGTTTFDILMEIEAVAHDLYSWIS